MMTTTARRPVATALRPRATGYPGYCIGLACRPSSVPLARMAARLTVQCWGLGEELAEDVALIATELVSNAVRHAVPVSQDPEFLARCRLSVERPTPDTVRVTVTDGSDRLVVKRNPDDDDTSGRGLFIVEALAANWGVTPRKTGKAVWAELKAKA